VKIFDKFVTSLDFFRFSTNNNILSIYFGTNALKWLNIEKIWFCRSNSKYLKSNSFSMKLNNSMFACKWMDNPKDQNMEVEMFHKANEFIFPRRGGFYIITSS
jgi:hypothetical protein